VCPEHRQQLQSAPPVLLKAGKEQDLVAFNGTWKRNDARSTPQDEILQALGCPWPLRSFVSSGCHTVEISTDGQEWTEVSHSVSRQIQVMVLDGSPIARTVPFTGRACEMRCSVVDKHGVVSETFYPDTNLRQVHTRRVEEDGAVYHVTNELHTATGSVIRADVFFDRATLVSAQ